MPFGFNSECNYDGSLSFNISFMNENTKMKVLNDERICIIKFLDNFLGDILFNIGLVFKYHYNGRSWFKGI